MSWLVQLILMCVHSVLRDEAVGSVLCEFHSVFASLCFFC